MATFIGQLLQRNRWNSLFSLFVLIALAACTSTEDVGPTKVSFMIFGDPPEQAVYQNVVQAFHQTNPNIQVELVGLPSKQDYMTRLTSDFAAGTPPDIFLLNYRRLAQFHNRNALEPLGPKLQASSQLQEAAYFSVALDAFRDGEGTLVCIPQNISSQVVYYNKSLFDAAGVAYPKPDWTWDEFRQLALTMTKPDNNSDGEPDQYGLGLEPALTRMAAFIWQNGGTLVDDNANPHTLTLDTPAVKEAMQFVFALSTEDNVVPNGNAEAVQSHQDRFYNGTIAMYVDSRRIVPIMREIDSFEWDVAPLPRGEHTANVLHSDGYCLTRSSEVKDAAWAFIEFAMGEEGQKIASDLGRTVPSLKHVAESSAFLSPNKPPANARVWLDAVPNIHVLPRLENWVQIERTASIEFEMAYLGLTTPDNVMLRIQQQSAQAFSAIK